MAKESIRLDKYLADMGIGTRSEVKNYIRKGLVQLNGEITKKPETKVKSGEDRVCVQGREVSYVSYEYYMLNKPAGVISATEDKKQKTVVDLIESKARGDLFPVGRLDKDTEGLLLITNDGQLTHELLSPKKHVDKVYYAKIAGKVEEEDVVTFSEGVKISEEFVALPAKLKILKVWFEDDWKSEIEVTIQEGKFHQVKKMFLAIGKEVTYLKRLSMGTLKLDENLEVGQYRKLTEEELKSLQQR